MEDLLTIKYTKPHEKEYKKKYSPLCTIATEIKSAKSNPIRSGSGYQGPGSRIPTQRPPIKFPYSPEAASAFFAFSLARRSLGEGGRG
jgi:hypothetical protein